MNVLGDIMTRQLLGNTSASECWRFTSEIFEEADLGSRDGDAQDGMSPQES